MPRLLAKMKPSEQVSVWRRVRLNMSDQLIEHDKLPDSDSVNGEDVEDDNPEINEPFDGNLANLRSHVLRIE